MTPRGVLTGALVAVAVFVGLCVPLAAIVMLSTPADSAAHEAARTIWDGAFAAVRSLGGAGWPAAGLLAATLALAAWAARRATPELRAKRRRDRARKLLERRYGHDPEALFLAYRSLSETPDENLPRLLAKLRSPAVLRAGRALAEETPAEPPAVRRRGEGR